MKRKIINDDNDRKKIKRESLTDYHAASSVHNFMLNDPILDWLKHKHKTSSSSSSSSSSLVTEDRFFNFIIGQGKKFEDKVMSQIKNTLNLKNITFVKIANNKEDIKYVDKYLETIEAINDQIGIIYQAVLHGNKKFKAFGSPDLLIRSDVVNLLFDQKIDDVPKRSDGKFNYIVIDIKFCTLKLRADAKFLLNESRMPANKAQIMIYNELLGIAQKYKPRYCYVLGRGWKYTKGNNHFECSRFNERLGVIDIEDKDSEYNVKIKKAFKWLDSVRESGLEWTWNPPSVPELYPNMSSKYDNGNKRKKKIAVSIDEITLMWNCGVKQRELAHKQGIYKLSDPRLTTDIMGFPKGTKRTKIIDKMLKFNQGVIHENSIVIPKYIDNNPYDWQNDVRIEFFLDFEGFSNIFDDFSILPNVRGPNIDPDEMSIIFMAGLGVSIKTSDGHTEWEYYNFRITELSNEHEYEMFDRLYKQMEIKCAEHNIKIKNAKVFHWGHIEQTLVTKLYTKYEDKHSWEDLCLIDFCKIFQDEAILIKGVYGFGLKAVGKGLIEHRLINMTSWENNVSDGLDAMVQAYSIYSNPDQDHSGIINDLINYNHIDVRMIDKIINYLRKNHIPFNSEISTTIVNN
jgi:hypothetical protein